VLSGIVVDEQRKPLPGAGISVFPADHRGGQLEYLKTDADGKYHFGHLPLDQALKLYISRDGFLEHREQLTIGAPSPSQELNLMLKRRPHGGTVRGTIHNPDGNPIAGAMVSNHGRSSRDVRTTTTDDSGNFLLDDLFEGSLGHELVVKAKGYAPQQMGVTPGSKQKPEEVVITLQKGHTLRARVVDQAGRPIAGASVYYDMGSGNAMHIDGHTNTNADGHFELDSLPPNPLFHIRADGYSELDDAELTLDGAEPITVTLEPQGILRGKLYDAQT
jgi:protocatechuate 3,4-dioxygenase beta subunit